MSDCMVEFAYYLEYLEMAKSGLNGPERRFWLDQVGTHYANVQQSIELAIEMREQEIALRMCLFMQNYWQSQGLFSDGLQNISAAVFISEPSNEIAAKIRYQIPSCNITSLKATALNNAGVLARIQGDLGGAEMFHEQSLAMRQVNGERAASASCYTGLGNVAIARSNYPRAAECFEQSMAIKQEFEDFNGIAGSLNNLGYTAYLSGDYAAAAANYRQGLTIWRNLGNLANIALVLQGFAELAIASGNFELAAQLWSGVESLRNQIATPLSATEFATMITDMKAAEVSLGESCFATARELGKTMTTNQMIELALDEVPFN